jgi:hypothetical protein
VHLLRKRRGVSGIISGVFLIGISVMILGAMYAQFIRFDHYNQVMLERLQREWERNTERLLITDVQTGVTKLRFNVTNCGAVAAHITDLYLTNLSATPYQHSRHSLDFWIAPGSTRYFDTGVTIENGDRHQFMITTERGNAFAPLAQSITNEPQPGGAQNVPFTFSFLREDFVYKSSSISVWTPAWKISSNRLPNEKDYVFGINITNTYEQTVVVLRKVDMIEATRLDFVHTDSWVPKLKALAISTAIEIPKKEKKLLTFSTTGETTGGGLPSSTGSYFVYFSVFYYFKDDQEMKIYSMMVSVLSQVMTT